MTDERDDLTDDQEIVAEEPESGAVEPTQDAASAEEQSEAEALARSLGWVPQDEFGGKPGFVDVGTFLARPVTQQRLLRRELADRDARLASIEASTRAAMEALRAQERERYDARIRELEAQRNEAVEQADVDRFRAVERQMREMHPPPAQERVEMPPPPEWVKDREAFAYARDAIQARPDIMMLPPERQLAWAERQVRDVFPEKFAAAETPAPAKATPVRSRIDSGGTGVGSPLRKGRSLADLPPEAQKAFRMFKAEGVPITEAQYVAEYDKG